MNVIRCLSRLVYTFFFITINLLLMLLVSCDFESSYFVFCCLYFWGTDMRRDVQEIFKMTPHDKQVMMFSATLSKEIRPVCKKFMQDVIFHGQLY